MLVHGTQGSGVTNWATSSTVAGWTHDDDGRHRLNFELWRDLAQIDFRLSTGSAR